MGKELAIFSQALSYISNKNWVALTDLLDESPWLATFTDENGHTLALELSGFSGSENYIKKIYELGGNFNIRTSEGETALGRAIERDSVLNTTIFVLRSLLECGADPNAITTAGDTPLLHAINFNKLPHFEALLNFGADVFAFSKDVFPTNAFHVAAKINNPAFRNLIEAGTMTK